MFKRITSLFLLVGVVFFLMPGFALAEKAGQDGLSLELKTGKNAYAAGEAIDVELIVTNSGVYGVTNGKARLVLPVGYAVANNGASEANLNLIPGQTETLSFYAARTDGNRLVPNTGDGSLAGTLAGVALVLFGALAFFFGFKKRLFRGFLSVFLCFALVAALAAPSVSLAAVAARGFTVTESIMVGGEALVLTAQLDYNCYLPEAPSEYPVTVNGGTGGGNYQAGATVTITAGAPAEGMAFTGWTVVSGGVTLANLESAVTTFTMPANAVEVTANYAVAYAVTVINGSGSGLYVPGQTVTIVCDEAIRANFGKWKVTTENVELADRNSPTTTFIMPAEPVSIKGDVKQD